MQAQVVETNVASRPMCAFLSFATEDKPLVEAFRSRIALQYPNLELLDHAVKDSYEENWKRACAKKIDRSAVLICLVRATTHRSQTVAWEIDHGLALGKRVVALNLTADGVRIPEALVRNAIEPQKNITGIILAPAATPPLVNRVELLTALGQEADLVASADPPVGKFDGLLNVALEVEVEGATSRQALDLALEAGKEFEGESVDLAEQTAQSRH